MKRFLVVVLLLTFCLPAFAKPKKKLYNNSSTELYVPGRGTWTFSPGWQRQITEATALAYH